MKTLSIIALSLATAMSGIPPANAFPVAPQVSRTTDVQKAQFPYERGEERKNRSSCAVPYCELGGRRGYYRDHDRHGYYRDGYYGDGYYRDGYYRDRYRHHYRHHDNDVGAFIGGLAAGAIVGGLLSQPRYYNGGSPHTRWCYARYRSYRAWDNTYQPYGGPRRQCYSPY